MSRRRAVQAASTFLLNPYLPYFSNRVIYQGGGKYLCAPGLNCYACPLAAFSCPVGGLQLAFANFSHKVRDLSAGLGVLIYVLGSVGLVGALVGRIPCGWVCPFGFLQDLLYKVPIPKLKLPRRANLGRYFFLAAAAMIPFLTGVSWFSRLCPAGTLEGGLFLKAVPPDAPLPAAGWFFWFKVAVLAGFLFWMMASKRPFCRAVCPLGAMFGLCNRISAYSMAVDDTRCNQCHRCREVCPVDINIFDDPNSPDCLRCLECKKACPRGAVASGFKHPWEGWQGWRDGRRPKG